MVLKIGTVKELGKRSVIFLLVFDRFLAFYQIDSVSSSRLKRSIQFLKRWFFMLLLGGIAYPYLSFYSSFVSNGDNGLSKHIIQQTNLFLCA